MFARVETVSRAGRSASVSPMAGEAGKPCEGAGRSTARPLFGESFTDVSAAYTLGKKLGVGNFGKVLHGKARRDAARFKLQAGDGVAIKARRPYNDPPLSNHNV